MSKQRKSGYAVLSLIFLSATALAAARTFTPATATSAAAGGAADPQVLHGRFIIITHDCGGCHGGNANPASPGWLEGERSPLQTFTIGPCAVTPGATPCFHTHPRNLTPDNETGLGRFTERQIFNALRYGLRPEDTPDVKITGTKPGEGNFPLHPHFLAPPMPWDAWRFMPDGDLLAIAAYLKHGLKPVHNKVPESEGPPDFWASAYKDMPEIQLGPYPPPPFPTANERASSEKSPRD